MPPTLKVPDTLIVATHNAGKLAEIDAMLAPLGVAVVGAGARGLPAPEETETTFAGNAALKARAAAAASGEPALADDSGLAIEALGGAPGVYSANWAQTQDGTRDYAAAFARIETALADAGADAGADPSPRAAFVCVVCYAKPDGEIATFEGRVEGALVFPPRGNAGFGYDPIFTPDGETRTFGEMAPVEKAALSHRGRALAAFKQALGAS
ncbi:MAG: RdgB/HAM1 family non-canonical purine NTP pyrophosphatase [Pseudomonadota bacterium]